MLKELEAIKLLGIIVDSIMNERLRFQKNKNFYWQLIHLVSDTCLKKIIKIIKSI